MHRPGRVGRDELDVDPPPAAERRAAEARALRSGSPAARRTRSRARAAGSETPAPPPRPRPRARRAPARPPAPRRSRAAPCRPAGRAPSPRSRPCRHAPESRGGSTVTAARSSPAGSAPAAVRRATAARTAGLHIRKHVHVQPDLPHKSAAVSTGPARPRHRQSAGAARRAGAGYAAPRPVAAAHRRCAASPSPSPRPRGRGRGVGGAGDRGGVPRAGRGAHAALQPRRRALRRRAVLPDRRSLWRFSDGSCEAGRWEAKGDAESASSTTPIRPRSAGCSARTARASSPHLMEDGVETGFTPRARPHRPRAPALPRPPGRELRAGPISQPSAAARARAHSASQR